MTAALVRGGEREREEEGGGGKEGEWARGRETNEGELEPLR